MIILYSDILHDRTPSYLKPIIPQTVKETSQGRYNLRNNSNINQTNTRTETFRKSYIPATTQFWNNLDDSIKDCTKVINVIHTNVRRTSQDVSPALIQLLEPEANVYTLYYIINREILSNISRLQHTRHTDKW